MGEYLNGGLPDIRLLDPNHLGRGHMFLQHVQDGKQLYSPYVKAVMTSLRKLWGGNREVILSTYDPDDKEIVFYTRGAGDVVLSTRDDYEKSFIYS